MAISISQVIAEDAREGFPFRRKLLDIAKTAAPQWSASMAAGRTGTLFLILTMGLLTAGCLVENEHSIIDKAGTPDKRLAGVWALEADGSAQVLVLRAR